MCEHIPPFLKFNYQLYNYIFNKPNKKKASQNQQTNPPIPTTPPKPKLSQYEARWVAHASPVDAPGTGTVVCVCVCVCVSKTGSLEKMVPFCLKNNIYHLYNICVCYSCVKDQSKHVLIRTLLVEGFLEMEDW